MSEFERIVHLSAAFDKRHPDPSKNYGIHGVELRMVLKGPKGATQFVLYTHWQLPHVTEEFLSQQSGFDRRLIKSMFLPLPLDKGYHWHRPLYDDQVRMQCEYLAKGFCYYDGSGSNAEDLYTILLQGGDEAVWKELETYYRELEARDKE